MSSPMDTFRLLHEKRIIALKKATWNNQPKEREEHLLYLKPIETNPVYITIGTQVGHISVNKEMAMDLIQGLKYVFGIE